MQEEAWTPADGMAGVAWAAIAADGVIEEEEADDLAEDLTRMQLFAELSDHELHRVLLRVNALHAQEHLTPFLNRCALALPDALRPTAFAIACDLILADGTLEEIERGFLGKLQKALHLPDPMANQIMEVIAIKNRG